SKKYYAFDFWENKLLGKVNGELEQTLRPQSCAVIALRAVADFPVVVSTSQHLTQGMIDVLDEQWSAQAKTLSGKSDIIAGDAYELRIAAERTYSGIPRVILADDDVAAGVTAGCELDGSLVRVTIQSPNHRTVSWKVVYP